MKHNFKQGDRVYLPSLDQYGTVEETTPSGRAKSVRIKTPNGEKVINVLNMVVRIGKALLVAWPVLETIYLKFKNLFK